jgi:hypothetical protein
MEFFNVNVCNLFFWYLDADFFLPSLNTIWVLKWWKLPFFAHFMDYKMWGINWESMGSKEDKVRMFDIGWYHYVLVSLTQVLVVRIHFACLSSSLWGREVLSMHDKVSIKGPRYYEHLQGSTEAMIIHENEGF